MRHTTTEGDGCNNYQWLSEQSLQKKVMGVYELDAIIALTAQVATFTKQVGSMKVNSIQASPFSYEYCGNP